jgi:hypothetical protein
MAAGSACEDACHLLVVGRGAPVVNRIPTLTDRARASPGACKADATTGAEIRPVGPHEVNVAGCRRTLRDWDFGPACYSWRR